MYLVINFQNPESSAIFEKKRQLCQAIGMGQNTLTKPVQYYKNFLILEKDVIKGNYKKAK